VQYVYHITFSGTKTVILGPSV